MVQKHVNLIDLVKTQQLSNEYLMIFLQHLASMQKRTIPIKFAHLAEKSEDDSISNLSTKATTHLEAHVPAAPAVEEERDEENLGAEPEEEGGSEEVAGREGRARRSKAHPIRLRMLPPKRRRKIAPFQSTSTTNRSCRFGSGGSKWL